MISCFECGGTYAAADCHEIANYYLCGGCGEKVVDVLHMAATLKMSMLDLAMAVVK